MENVLQSTGHVNFSHKIDKVIFSRNVFNLTANHGIILSPETVKLSEAVGVNSGVGEVVAFFP